MDTEFENQQIRRRDSSHGNQLGGCRDSPERGKKGMSWRGGEETRAGRDGQERM